MTSTYIALKKVIKFQMTTGINKIKNIFIKVLKCFCIKYQNENLS